MAVAAILPQPQPILRSLADALAHTHAQALLYGDSFARALHRAVAHVEAGTAYEPYNALYYRVQSFSRAWLWHCQVSPACGPPAKVVLLVACTGYICERRSPAHLRHACFEPTP